MSDTPHLGAQQALPPSSPQSLFHPDIIYGPSTDAFPPPIDRFEQTATGGCGSQYLRQVLGSSSSSYSSLNSFQASASTSTSLPVPVASPSSDLQPLRPPPPSVSTTYFDALYGERSNHFEHARLDPRYEWLPLPAGTSPISPTVVNRDSGRGGCPAIRNTPGPGFGDGLASGLPRIQELHAAPFATPTGRHDQLQPAIAATPSGPFQGQTPAGANTFQFDNSPQFTTPVRVANFSTGGETGHHHAIESGSNRCLRTTALSDIGPEDIINVDNLGFSIFSADNGSGQAPSTAHLQNLNSTHSSEPNLSFYHDNSFTSFAPSTSTSQQEPPRLPLNETVTLPLPRLPLPSPIDPTATEAMPGRRNVTGRGTPARGRPIISPPSLVLPTGSSTSTMTRQAARKRDSGVAGVDDIDTLPKKIKTNGKAMLARGTDIMFTDDDDSDKDSVIDLREEVIPDFSTEEKRKKGEMIKLSQFQCAICMDFATALTVTHCGMLLSLFCSKTGKRCFWSR